MSNQEERACDQPGGNRPLLPGTQEWNDFFESFHQRMHTLGTNSQPSSGGGDSNVNVQQAGISKRTADENSGNERGPKSAKVEETTSTTTSVERTMTCKSTTTVDNGTTMTSTSSMTTGKSFSSCSFGGHSVQCSSTRGIGIQAAGNRILLTFNESSTSTAQADRLIQQEIRGDNIQITMDGIDITVKPKAGTPLDQVLVIINDMKQLEIIISE